MIADRAEPARPVEWAVRASLIVAGLAIAVALLAPGVTIRYQVTILAVGFVIGMPHGAVDHLVGFWTGHLSWRPTTLVIVLLGYLGLAAAAWVVLSVGGSWTLAAFLLVSVLHFGAGDVMAEGRPRSGRWSIVVAVIARGGPVVAGPLWFWPDETARQLRTLQPDLPVAGIPLRLLLVVLVGVCMVIAAVTDWRAGQRRGAAEFLLLGLLFTLTPPLAAFGVYFGFWHGLRHSARLIVSDGRNAATLAAGRPGAAVARFLRAAALPSAVALLATAALVLLAVTQQHFISTVFLVLLALTAPHLVAVGLLDARAATVRQRRRPVGQPNN